MKRPTLIILALLACAAGVPVAASTVNGLTWGVQLEQYIAYRVVTNLTDSSHGGIVEDTVVLARINMTPPIPEVIEALHDLPFASGQLYSTLGVAFVPYIAGLSYVPSMVADPTHILAAPTGNWTLVHSLYEEYGFYSLTQNDTHYVVSLGVIVYIPDDARQTFTPSQTADTRTLTKRAYFKDNGTVALYIRTFENSTHNAAFSMTQIHYEARTSTQTGTRTEGRTDLLRELLIISVGCGATALVLAATYILRKRRRG